MLGSLNKKQTEAVSAFKNVFVNLPTGYGKSTVHSLCSRLNWWWDRQVYCLDRRAYSRSYARPSTVIESEGDLS